MSKIISRQRKRNRVILFFTALITIFISVNGYPSGLHTTDFNYINDLVGGRATGMAGAYTAISDDPAGAYYNPAGLVFAPDNQISLSVNTYKRKFIEYKKVMGNKPYKQDISSFYPSMFGVIQSIGPVKVALTILNLNSEILDQDDRFNLVYPDQYGDVVYHYPMTFTINYNITDSTIQGGLSTAWFITDWFSMGVTAYLLRRRSEQISNQILTFDESSRTGFPYMTYEHINIYITELMWGMTGRFGMQIMPLNWCAIGLSIGKGFIFTHEEDGQNFNKSRFSSENYAEGQYAVNDKGTVEIYKLIKFYSLEQKHNDSKIPVDVRLGVAFFPSKKLIVSADLIAHIGDQYYQNEVNIITVNAALGVEFYMTSSFPVRAGLFTNFANTPKIEKNKDGQEMHTDRYGASLSFGWETKNSSISLGGFYQFGFGQAQVFGPGSYQIQDVTVHAFSVSLTGSAKY